MNAAIQTPEQKTDSTRIAMEQQSDQFVTAFIACDVQRINISSPFFPIRSKGSWSIAHPQRLAMRAGAKRPARIRTRDARLSAEAAALCGTAWNASIERCR